MLDRQKHRHYKSTVKKLSDHDLNDKILEAISVSPIVASMDTAHTTPDIILKHTTKHMANNYVLQ